MSYKSCNCYTILGLHKSQHKPERSMECIHVRNLDAWEKHGSVCMAKIKCGWWCHIKVATVYTILGLHKSQHKLALYICSRKETFCAVCGLGMRLHTSVVTLIFSPAPSPTFLQSSIQKTPHSPASNWPRRDYRHSNSKWEELHSTDKHRGYHCPGD